MSRTAAPGVPPLPISGDPRDVAGARDWVRTACGEGAHRDLLDSASLGVSELLTNALLHAEPPYTLHWVDAGEHPRVEVHDATAAVPRPREGDDSSLVTLGRGLHLISMVSRAWGVRVHAQGKVVWFEPTRTSEAGSAREPLIEFTPTATVSAPVSSTGRRIEWQGLNRPIVESLMRRQHALRREVTLVNLRRPSPARTAFLVALDELRQQLPLEYFHPPDEAIHAWTGVGTVEPEAVARSGTRLLHQFSLIHSEHDLLSVTRDREVAVFTDWLLGEVTRQCAGEAPRAWSGPLARTA